MRIFGSELRGNAVTKSKGSLWLCKVKVDSLTVRRRARRISMLPFVRSFQLNNSLNIKIRKKKVVRTFLVPYNINGGEGWLGFPDLWSGQKPGWNWYLTPVVNFGEVRRAQLAKSTLLISSFVPLGYFQIFLRFVQILKERVGCGKQREATAPIHP